MEIARNQKRDFGLIHFSGDHNPKNLRVDYFLKDDPYSIIKIIDACEFFDGGGTNFEAPLQRSMQIIDNHEAFTKADITFITDGESAIGDKFKKKFNEWKKEKNVRVFSILIDDGGYGSSTATLKEFTRPEDIVQLKDMKADSQDEVAIQIFDNI